MYLNILIYDYNFIKINILSFTFCAILCLNYSLFSLIKCESLSLNFRFSDHSLYSRKEPEENHVFHSYYNKDDFKIFLKANDVEYCDHLFIDKNNSLKDLYLDNTSRNRRAISFQTGNLAKLFANANQLPQDNEILSNKKAKTIETAIFIDKYLAAKFLNKLVDLKNIVLTIMNQVQIIYNYNSMKSKIRIIIVKYEVLTGLNNSPNSSNGDIDKYLDNFCSWQAKKHRLENWKTRWDHALLLTGLDLYKDLGNGKKNKKVLGLAWVNGMCKQTYSCTLNEGKSFEASFVIAHEMGHSLGILHDAKGNNCDGNKYLMSEKTGPGKVNWSSCSNAYIENFISKGHAKCLEDNSLPTQDLDFKKFNKLPGELYDANVQCQMALGQQYSAYVSTKNPFNDICRELWCITGNWATPAHPALDGTKCSDNSECSQGQCKIKVAFNLQTSKPNLNKFASVQKNYLSIDSTENKSKSDYESDKIRSILEKKQPRNLDLKINLQSSLIITDH